MPNQLFVIENLNEVMGDYIFRRESYSDIFCDPFTALGTSLFNMKMTIISKH